MNKVEEMLGKIALAFTKLSGVEVKLTDYKTKAGDTISVDDQTGETKAADGTYELEDGNQLVVKDGKAEAPAAKDDAKDGKGADDSAKADDAPESDAKDEAKAGDADLQAQVDALTKELTDLKQAVSDLQGQSADLAKAKTELSALGKEVTTALSEIKSTPADKKVVLNASTEATEKSKGQSAWELYQAAKK